MTAILGLFAILAAALTGVWWMERWERAKHRVKYPRRHWGRIK